MNSNFFPSDDWLNIRWNDLDPDNADRGKPHPVQSEIERREIENESEAGIKRRHRRSFAIAFIHVIAKNALEEFFSRGGEICDK